MRITSLIYASIPNFVAFGFVLVAISAWFLQVGFTAAQIGLLVGVQGAALITSAVPLGFLSDVYGRRRILIAGALAASGSILIIALTFNLALLVFAMALGGVAEGAITATWNAMIADQTSGDGRTRAFSLSFVVSNVGTGAGFLLPVFIPVIATATGLGGFVLHRDLLLLLALMSFATPLSFAWVLRGYAERHTPSGGGVRQWGGLKNKGTLARMAIFSGSIGLGAGFIIPLIATWLSLRFGAGDYYSGPILAISNFVIGFSSLASPRLASRFGLQRAIVISTGSSTLFMLAMAFITNVNIAAACYIVRTSLMNMSGPLTDNFVMGLFPPEQRGLVSGLTNIIFRLPNSVSVLAGGYLLSIGLLEAPWFIAVALYVFGIAMFYRFFGRVKTTY